MNDQIRYFRFIARFVDAVVTEPLAQTLRQRPAPIRMRPSAPIEEIADITPPLPRAA